MASELAYKSQLDTATKMPSRKKGTTWPVDWLTKASWRRASRVTGWVPRGQWIGLRKAVGYDDWIGQAGWRIGLRVDWFTKVRWTVRWVSRAEQLNEFHVAGGLAY